MAASEAIAARFPPNPFLDRLVHTAREWGIRFEASPVFEQWLYHPVRRAILVWLPDLEQQSLSYLVTIMAHELGHAADFDRRPDLVRRLASGGDPRLQHALERAAFVNGFVLLKRLSIPVSLSQYVAMVEPPMDRHVERALRRRLCCLLDRRLQGAAVRAQPAPQQPAGLPPVA